MLSRYLLRCFITVGTYTKYIKKKTKNKKVLFTNNHARIIFIIQNVNNYERNLYVFDTKKEKKVE